jgi:luciferase family oxidoreductase group 1
MNLQQTRLSILDLVTYAEGATVADAIETSRQLAQRADELGYHRYWVAEHHNLEGIASSATVVLMGFLAGHTQRIRIGSGGIMLPNHAPYIVAEQVGTLASIYPDRIDLGLGRAPGTDPMTMRALKRVSDGSDFDQQVAEIERWLAPVREGQRVKAIPGAGTEVPMYILGSSLYSAHLAAKIGKPYAFASHFAPQELMPALAIYREEFQPSAALDKPYVMVGVPMMAAENDERAEFLATTMYQRSLGILKGGRAPLQPPVAEMDWTEAERYAVAERMSLFVVGGPDRVRAGFNAILEATQADELILVSDAYDRADRIRSFEVAMEAAKLDGHAGSAQAR